MTKREAIRQIRECADWMIRFRIKDYDFMRDEVEMTMEFISSEDWIESSTLREYDNGFYIGDIKNGNKHGYGAFLWYKSSSPNSEPNSVYIGHWDNGKRTGEGLNLSSGLCYWGDFLNGNYHGESAQCVGRNGLVILADFYNGDITRVRHCTSDFTYNGKSYKKNSSGSSSSSSYSSSGSSSSDSGGSSCLGYIIIAVFIFLFFKYCSSCSCSHASEKTISTEFVIQEANTDSFPSIQLSEVKIN